MPSPQVDVDLLTPADAARILSLSVDMVRILATSGQLPTAAKTTRGARLFRRDDVEELAATRAGRPVHHHSVQFYEGDAHLVGVVAGVLVDALRMGAPAIVIATESHRQAVVERLKTFDVAVDDAIDSGQLLLLDARQMLETFMVEGWPDEQRFREQIGGAVERARKEWSRARLRAYGEMVDLLWKDGRREAAIELEEIWNRLAAIHPFSLLCAYSMSNFPSGNDGELFDRICGTHTRVVPAESFHQGEGIDHRHREIARLQQRASALENELAERERTEQALQKAKRDLERYSQQLGEALQAKDEILAILGHELRNPLAPILSAIELLRAREVDSRAHAIIARQVRHLHHLVEDLLDVGRLLRGKVQLERRPVEVAQIVDRALALAAEVLDHRREDMDLRVRAGGVTLTVDLERMAQGLSNLLRNAAQNSESGSKIVLDAEASDESVTVTVSDSGAGIAADLLPRVFDLFVQHPQPLDRSRGGLGIGLAIAKNIVELHGGTVVARSEGLGSGSEFSVTIPRSAPEPVSRSAPASLAEPTPEIEKRRVLVVDDNEDAAEMLAELLSECGHDVEVAHSAGAALEAARRFAPDLALLDIGLPVVNGHELAKRLRTQDPSLRLVAVSGYGDHTNRARSSEAGFEAHLVKPVRIDDLLKLLEAR